MASYPTFRKIRNVAIVILCLYFISHMVTISITLPEKPEVPEEQTSLGEVMEFPTYTYCEPDSGPVNYDLPEEQLAELSTADLVETILHTDLLVRDKNEPWEQFYGRALLRSNCLVELLNREDVTEALLYRYRHTELIEQSDVWQIIKGKTTRTTENGYNAWNRYYALSYLDTLLVFDQFNNGDYSSSENQQVAAVMAEQALNQQFANVVMPTCYFSMANMVNSISAKQAELLRMQITVGVTTVVLLVFCGYKLWKRNRL